jgi:dihydroorotate dehydrogenase electron transfer subunit
MASTLMAAINKNAVQQIVSIVSNKRVGAYHQILLNVGDIVRNCRPGNFVAINVGGENSRMILRRAFAISRVSENSQYGGTMELIVAPHGSGSKWLCAQAEGTEIDIVAPLGTAFGIPTEPINALLIGGGYGSAPLFGLADVLKNRGCKVDMLLGASIGSKIYAPMEGKRSVNSLKIYTEDGSDGRTWSSNLKISSRLFETEISMSSTHVDPWRCFLPLPHLSRTPMRFISAQLKNRWPVESVFA